VLATRVLARAAELAGHEVVTSEVHGMSQRGGTVVTTVRYGDEVLSSAIPDGEADILLAFERLEAARHLPLVRGDGRRPGERPAHHAVHRGPQGRRLPGDLQARAEAQGVTIQLYPGLRLARELGNDKLSSTVMLGALSNFLFIPREHWHAAIRESVPPKTVEANEVAFDTGAEWAVGSAAFSF
jgi:indolepyruvate ferredoxin oxidoreductase, beta subunit